jgi:hypothetical protein
VLADAITQIHTKNASQLSYENLYRTAYKIVLKKEGGQLYQNVREFETSWLVQNVLPRIQDVLPASLLAGLENISNIGTSDNEKRTAGERVMRTMNEAFTDHQTCMAMLADVLMYMVSFVHVTVQCMRRDAHISCRKGYTVPTNIARRSIPRAWIGSRPSFSSLRHPVTVSWF